MASPFLMDQNVAKIKFNREAQKLVDLQPNLRKMGWIIELIEYPLIRVTFLATSIYPIIAPFTVELDCMNYNLLPPSVKFIHPVSFDSIGVRGIQLTQEGPHEVIISSHPETKLPFLCLPGVREYHSHPQHNGDSWDLYRYSEYNSFYLLLEEIWLYCVRTISKIRLQLVLDVDNVGLSWEAQL